MVANRLRKNLRKLKSWREREAVSCYRAYDADLPEYAAAIDVYATDETPSRTFLHVQEYAAPADIPEAIQRRRLNELLAAARDVFGVDRERIALKTRARGKGGSKYARETQFDARGEFIVVREGNVRLRVNLFDYLDTGLFLDHRPLRLRIADEARGHALPQPVRLHRRRHRARRRRPRAHHDDRGPVGHVPAVVCGQSRRRTGSPGRSTGWCRPMRWHGWKATRANTTWSSATRRRFPTPSGRRTSTSRREHVRLLRAAVARLARDGVLYFSNNFRRFRLDADAIAGFARVEDISPATIPPDFERNPRIHRCWRLRRLDSTRS